MALKHTTYLNAVLRLDRGRFAVSVPDVLLHIQDGWLPEDRVNITVTIERASLRGLNKEPEDGR